MPSPVNPATTPDAPPPGEREGSYFRYRNAAYARPDAFPLCAPRPDPALYQPAAAWIGRLILPRPDERAAVVGAWLEVHHAPPAHESLVGRVVRLRWADTPEANQRFWAATRSVRFDREARKYVKRGYVLAERVDHWTLVNPFESLAAAYPADEMIVRLPEPVTVDTAPGDGGPPVLSVPREPVQITGRYYALVRFVGPAEESGGGTPGAAATAWRVAHYRRESGAFDGPEEAVLLPATLPNEDGVRTAVDAHLDRSPANEAGWYIYGAPNAAGVFVVQALAPRALVRLAPGETVTDPGEKRRFFGLSAWRARAAKGTVSSSLLCPEGVAPEDEIARWREGDAALVIHLYGKYVRRDWTWQRLRLTWGHFAFGIARVVREPLAGELCFDIEYHQVYVHGEEGIVSGTHHWTRYAGDRQFGFLGTHPMQDLLIRLDCLTGAHYDLSGVGGGARRAPLEDLARELETMGARYRIADGRGGARISPSNNCAQDSNQALYATIRRLEKALGAHPARDDWRAASPADAARLDRLATLGRDLRRTLFPFGAARADWEWNAPTIGSSLAENPLTSLLMALRTPGTMLPSVAQRRLAAAFLRHGASAWVLRSHQVGGHDDTIRPRVPNV